MAVNTALAVTYSADTSSTLATAYPWIDIASTSATPGTQVALGDDVVSSGISIGFNFTYGSSTYNTLKISSNGILFFGSTNTAYSNTSLGSSSYDAALYPFWDDLNPANVGTRILYKSFGSSPNRYFVVSFINVPYYTAQATGVTFQAVLYEDGRFLYRYGTTGDSGASATLGYQVAQSSSDYVQYSINSASASNNLVILWQRAATLLGEYHLEESIWDGSSSEVKDSSGNNANGRAVSPYPVPTSTSPARTSSPGTCSYGAFNGGSIQLTGLGTSDSGKSTVSFWMYWNGTETIMPIGWNYYDLWFNTGSFGFNTNNSDIYGISSSGLANGWHHIVAEFTNTFVNQNRLYVDGVEKSLSQKMSNSFGTANATITSSLTLSGWSASNSYRFRGNLDEVKVYKGALSQAQVTALYNETHTCSAAAQAHHIRLEHGGSGVTCAPNTVTVKACKDAACSALITSSSTVTLSSTAGTWSTNPVTFTGSTTATLSVTSPQTVTLGTSLVTPAATTSTDCWAGATATCNLTFADSGFLFNILDHVAENNQSFTISAVQKSSGSNSCTSTFGNTAKTIKFTCNYIDPGTGTLPVRVANTALNSSANNSVACDSNGQAISVSFDSNGTGTSTLQYADVGKMRLNASYTNPSTGLTMTGSDTFIAAPAAFSFSNVTAGPIKAGSPFSATVTAVNANNVATPNFGQETTPEGVTLTRQLASPSGSGAVAGTLTGTFSNFSAGAATNNALTYSEVGLINLVANLTSANYLTSGLNVSGSKNNVGEFVPHHFITTLNEGCAAYGFTYSGQALSNATITAENASNQVTHNYDGTANTSPNYAKTVSLSAITLPEPAAALGTFSPATLAASNFSAGIATLSNSPTFSFSNLQTPPTDIALRALDVNASSSGFTEGVLHAYSGRMQLSNANGSELLPLSVPLEVQYWSSSNAYERNTLDNCTTVAIPTAASGLNFSGGGLSAGQTVASMNGVLTGNGTFVAGNGLLSLSAPNNPGYLDLSINAPPYLEFKWQGSSASDPTARASFGLYKGDSRHIFLREVY